MQREKIEYVPLWSPWLRASHWIIALGTLFQIASAWGMDNDAFRPAFWRDWHVMVGQLIALALALRILLLFLPGSSHWSSLAPRRAELAAMVAMIKFYVSFTRWPLPRWFAHNPLWKLLYVLVLLALVVSAVSGLMHHALSGPAAFHGAALHGIVATPITLFALAHVIAVFLHDLKGRGALVSAMISGNRYVHVEARGEKSMPRPSNEPIRVPLDRIGRNDRS